MINFTILTVLTTAFFCIDKLLKGNKKALCSKYNQKEEVEERQESTSDRIKNYNTEVETERIKINSSVKQNRAVLVRIEIAEEADETYADEEDRTINQHIHSENQKKVTKEKTKTTHSEEKHSHKLEDNSKTIETIARETLQHILIEEINNNLVIADSAENNTLAKLEISPQFIELLPKQEYKFEVFGYDATGNKIELDKVSWKCSKGGIINSSGAFKGDYTNKEVTVTVKCKNIKSSAKVILTPIVRDLIITPQDIILTPGVQQEFVCSAIDQYGNFIDIDRKRIVWDAAGGTINSDGILIVDSLYSQNCLIKAKYISGSQNNNYSLLNLSISLKIFSYILSLDIFQASISELISEPDKTIDWIEATFTMLAGNGFNFDWQTYLIMKVIDLLSYLLDIFYQILINRSVISTLIVVPVVCKEKSHSFNHTENRSQIKTNSSFCNREPKQNIQNDISEYSLTSELNKNSTNEKLDRKVKTENKVNTKSQQSSLSNFVTKVKVKKKNIEQDLASNSNEVENDCYDNEIEEEWYYFIESQRVKIKLKDWILNRYDYHIYYYQETFDLGDLITKIDLLWEEWDCDDIWDYSEEE